MFAVMISNVSKRIIIDYYRITRNVVTELYYRVVIIRRIVAWNVLQNTIRSIESVSNVFKSYYQQSNAKYLAKHSIGSYYEYYVEN